MLFFSLIPVTDTFQHRFSQTDFMNEKGRVLIAMSGGVDSSVAAFLMKQQGYECIGCTMKLYQNEDAGIDKSRTCCSLSDTEDARNVAFKLDIPYYVLNFSDDFRNKIIKKFADAYIHGFTPNPCIDCNKYMKFSKLYARARELDCKYIVTGHYARVEYESGKYFLKKALDESKDQSYVLYDMTQEQLEHTLFPLGHLRKTETREIAEENGLVTAFKPDSQDICFVPDGNYAEVVKLHSDIPVKSGNFIDIHGNVVGRHKGIIYYTIGQRRGIGISSSHPLYVCRISARNNTVTVGREEDLYSKMVFADNFNFISDVYNEPFRCSAKIRYRHKEQPALAIPMDNNCVKIIFDEPQRAVTPGQSAVLYDGDTVIGGGIIRCETEE